MFYKLSNTATLDEIQEYFGLPFKYPNLYEEEVVIDGLKESNLIIKTQENPNQLEMAIWGILPEKFSGSWKTFQSVKNTLNYNVDVLLSDKCFGHSFKERRCLITVTGFFTAFVLDGQIIPHYVYLSSKKPFTLAGIYNRLSDGFLTCSILLTNKSKQLNKIQNLSCEMPIIVSRSDSAKWLSNSFTEEGIDEIVDNSQRFMLEMHPVSTELYKLSTPDMGVLKPVSNNRVRNPN